MNTFSISEFKNNDFTAKMDKFTKRAHKLGLTFGYTLESESVESYWMKDGKVYKSLKNTDNAQQFFYTVYHYSVYGDSPVINGFSFLAKIEKMENGLNIIHSHNGEYDFTAYRESELTCEHCKVNRFRNFYYLIENESNKSVKMVGKNCLAQYIDQPNAEQIAEFYNEVLGIEDTFNNESEFESDSFSHKSFMYKILDLLTYANIIIKEKGYTGSNGEYPTKYRAMDAMYETRKEYRIIITDEDKEETKKIVSVVKEYLDNQKELSNYEYTIQTLINSEYAKPQHAGYIVSIIPLYNKILGIELENKKESKVESNFIGNVGDKVENITTIVSFVSCFETQYGITHLYKFDYNGNILSWFSSNDLNLEVGNQVTITKGNIKGHNEFKGNKETIITRCKIK